MTSLTKQEKVVWGKALERELKPLIERYLGYSLTATEYAYDSVDMISNSGNTAVELKGRPDLRSPMDKSPAVPQYSTDWDEWIIPYCKIWNKRTKRLYFFYYWAGDNTLWAIKYKASQFNEYTRAVPFQHTSNQLHIYIPKDDWIDITEAVGLVRRPIPKKVSAPLFIDDVDYSSQYSPSSP